MAAKTKVWHKPDEQAPRVTKTDEDQIVCHLVDGSLISCAWCGEHFHVCIPIAPDGFDQCVMAPQTVIEWAYKHDLLADGGTIYTEAEYEKVIEATSEAAHKWFDEQQQQGHIHGQDAQYH